MSKIQNKNTMIKFLALFISILLWSYVRGEVNPKAIREFKGVNVEFINERILNDVGLIVLNPKEVKISVKVSGRRSDVNAVKPEDITAQVDLSGASKGNQRILIDVSVPFKVDLEDISERYVSIEADNLNTIKKQVEIKLNREDNIIKESIISPQIIKISGPSTLTDKVAKVIVNVDIDKIKENSALKLPVKVVDKKGKEILGLQTNPDMVEISIPLLKTKKVMLKPNWLEGLEEVNLSDIIINPTTVTIRGLEKDIKDLEEIETEAIDISNIKESDTVEVGLILPKGITLDNGENKITLTIETETSKYTVKELLVPLDQIEIKNLKEDFISTFYDIPSTKEISIKIKGNKEKLNEINTQDLNLYLDLEGLEDGIYDVDLKVIEIKEIEIKEIETETIKVKIQKK